MSVEKSELKSIERRAGTKVMAEHACELLNGKHALSIILVDQMMFVRCQAEGIASQ